MEQLKKEFYDRFGGLGGVNPALMFTMEVHIGNFVPVEAIVRQGRSSAGVACGNKRIT
jgi:hypothetical protein